jgi:hypothetical protein
MICELIHYFTSKFSDCMWHNVELLTDFWLNMTDGLYFLPLPNLKSSPSLIPCLCLHMIISLILSVFLSFSLSLLLSHSFSLFLLYYLTAG